MNQQMSRRGLFGLIGGAALAVALPNVAHATSTEVGETPRFMYGALYHAGLVITGPTIQHDGLFYQPTLRRIQPADGRYYALLTFGGREVAISEADGSVWSPAGNLWENHRWTMSTLDLVAKAIEVLVFLWNDPLMLLAVLLLIALVLIVIIYIMKLWFNYKFDQIMKDRPRPKDKDKLNELGQFDQWHNVGLAMWMFGPNEVSGHESFHHDMSWLANNNAEFGREMRADPNAGYWLETGRLPGSYVQL
jgi:hypothetical protein